MKKNLKTIEVSFLIQVPKSMRPAEIRQYVSRELNNPLILWEDWSDKQPDYGTFRMKVKA